MMVMLVNVVLRLSRFTDLVLCVVCWNVIMLARFLSVMWKGALDLGTANTTF